MRRILGTFGTIGALGIGVACNGSVRDLGGDNTGGTPPIGGAGSTGGATAGGNGPGETGGSAPIDPDPIAPVTPYVVDPTVPIDPTCTCTSPDEVCNAANQCVPRCDDGNRCARWLASQPVSDLLIDGSTLYVTENAIADPLGNPGKNGVLYRIALPDGALTRVAANLGNPTKILGRYNNATFIRTSEVATSSILMVMDDGNVTTLDTTSGLVSFWGHWLAYVSGDGKQLLGLDLDAPQQPIVLEPDASKIVASIAMRDVVVFFRYFLDTTPPTYTVCTVQLTNSPSAATCGVWYHDLTAASFATSGTEYYLADGFGGISSFAPPSKPLLTLYQASAGRTVYDEGWLYFISLDNGSASHPVKFARVPTTVGRLPQDILPESMATRHSTYSIGTSWGGSDALVFAISSSDVYWVQVLPPVGQNKPQYIFSAPLPPKPCDAELPCQDSALVCKDGLCSKP